MFDNFLMSLADSGKGGDPPKMELEIINRPSSNILNEDESSET